MTILIDEQNHFTTSNTHSWLTHKYTHTHTNFSKLEIQWELQWNFINLIKNIYKKLSTNIILNYEKLEVSPLRSETSHGCPLSLLLLNIVLEFLANGLRQEKEVKCIQ